MSTDRFADAEALALEALEIRRAKLPPDHPHIAGSLLVLGRILLRNNAAASEPLLREALTISKDKLPAEHRQVVTAQIELGHCLTSLERFEEAEVLLLDVHITIKRAFDGSDGSSLPPLILERLVSLYTAWNRPSDAERYRDLQRNSIIQDGG